MRGGRTGYAGGGETGRGVAVRGGGGPLAHPRDNAAVWHAHRGSGTAANAPANNPDEVSGRCFQR